jgi:hypothetical protein
MIREPMSRARALLLVLVTLALTGCGAQRTVVVRGQTLHLHSTEYRITPTRLQVHAGVIHIESVDDGILTHNVKVFSTRLKDPQGNFVMVGGTDTAHPGEVARGTVDLAPGTYRLACSLGSHEDLGEYAILVVTP